MHHFHRAPLRTALRLLVPALALAGSAAMAQEQARSPYYIGASQAFSRDSNIYRTATGEVGETISSTGLLGGIDQPFGRQRFYADGSVQSNRYRHLSELNNVSYALTTGLDWSTIEFLSGALRYTARRNQADYGSLTGSTAPNHQTTQQFTASARYGLTSRLAFDAGFEHRRLAYSNVVFENRNYNQNTENVGLTWGTPGLLTFGAGLRLTQGETPKYQAIPPFADELRRRDVDLTSTWSPTGFSTLNARISATREKHSQATSTELSGTTGTISWDYRATGKLNFTTSLSRDTGTEITFSDTALDGSQPVRVDNNRLSNSAQLDVRYALTGKVSLNGNAHHIRGTNSTGHDSVTGYGLGANYLPTRSVALGCTLGRESRDTAGVTAYVANTATCSAQITLR